jgi:hypothetical protein
LFTSTGTVLATFEHPLEVLLSEGFEVTKTHPQITRRRHDSIMGAGIQALTDQADLSWM